MLLDKIIYPSVTVKRAAPLNLVETDKWLFESEWLRKISQINLIETDGVSVGSEFVFYTRRGRHSMLNILNPRYTTSSNARKLYRICKERILSKTVSFQGPLIWVTDEWSGGYFHWMLESLSRLLVAVQNVNDDKLTIVLPEHYRNLNFVTDTLPAFNVRPLFFGRREIVKPDKLVFPSAIEPTGNYHPQIILDLKNTLSKYFSKKQISSTTQKRIYISRGKALRRRIVNENEIYAILIKHNFKVVYYELLNMSEQALLTMQAECVISSHGAGLTNIIYMRPGTKVIELRKRGDSINNCYFSLSNSLGLDYLYLLCTSTGVNHNDDIEVSSSALDSLLTEYVD